MFGLYPTDLSALAQADGRQKRKQEAPATVKGQLMKVTVDIMKVEMTTWCRCEQKDSRQYYLHVPFSE
jgi:hypothetical protein